MENQELYSFSRCKNPLTCAGRETTPTQGRRSGAQNGNLSKFGRIYRVGTVFAQRQHLYQKGARGMERPEMYSFSRCKNPLTCAGRETTPTQGRRSGAENGNLSKFGRIYRVGTVFAQRQHLYQKGARGMERPEMHSFSRWKYHSYLCLPSNYPVSMEAVKGREWKPARIGEDLSPWYSVCTKAKFISKDSHGYGEIRNVFL